MNGYWLRNFVEGDEKKIIDLFNDVYGRLGGYVPRTVEYWRWCCLKRPDVRKDGIFLFFDNGTENLEGYIVVGLSGNIWEWCSKPDRKDVVLILLDSAISYLKEMGVSSVTTNVHGGDEVLNEACRRAGFARVNVHKMFVGVLSFKRLISILVWKKVEALSKKFNEKICIRIKDVPFWIEKAISISVNDGEVVVDEGSVSSPSISVQTDVKTLSSVLLGILSPRQAVLSFRIRVKPFWKIPTLADFLGSICLNDPWFWPLSDFG